LPHFYKSLIPWKIGGFLDLIGKALGLLESVNGAVTNQFATDVEAEPGCVAQPRENV
jgi:hypothetical protein